MVVSLSCEPWGIFWECDGGSAAEWTAGTLHLSQTHNLSPKKQNSLTSQACLRASHTATDPWPAEKKNHRDFLSISGYESRQECGHRHEKLVWGWQGAQEWTPEQSLHLGWMDLQVQNEYLWSSEENTELNAFFEFFKELLLQEDVSVFLSALFCSHPDHGQLPPLSVQ